MANNGHYRLKPTPDWSMNGVLSSEFCMLLSELSSDQVHRIYKTGSEDSSRQRVCDHFNRLMNVLSHYIELNGGTSNEA